MPKIYFIAVDITMALKILSILIPALLVCLLLYFFYQLYTHTDTPITSEAQTGGILDQDKKIAFEIDFKALKIKLDMGYHTNYADVIKIPRSTIVEGKEGDYYFVDLKNAKTEEILLFKAGEYTIDGLDKKFSASITQFYNDVVQVTAKVRKPEIFIKGSADASGNGSFKQRLIDVGCQSEDFLHIPVHRRIGGTLYQKEPTVESLQIEDYTNEELPNLRARFIQCQLKDTYSDIESKI
jgi:hypothetical protein